MVKKQKSKNTHPNARKRTPLWQVEHDIRAMQANRGTLDELDGIAALEKSLKARKHGLVVALRASGHTWEAIGKALGMSAAGALQLRKRVDLGDVMSQVTSPGHGD